MSERWGFDLSMEAVRLMRHRLGEWQEFAVQKLEGADIETRLAELVAQVKTPASVDIFLPRDQILFTDVKLAGDTPSSEEIYSAMDGRTPYDLADLEIDWVTTAPGTARVAAIARQTLDEAEAFVTTGGLTVRAFSSLAAPADFPRPPVFIEREPLETLAPEKNAPEEEAWAETTTAPAFSTGRTSSPPLVLNAANKTQPKIDDGPVVKVDDPTPVLQLPETELPPLNPGAPLPRVTSEPRIVTNVGASAAAARAASLTATPSIAVRHRERALPTLALAGIAAGLSIAIAIVIWAILPSTPESSLVSPESVDATTQPAVEIAEATSPTVDDATPEASPLPNDIASVSDVFAPPALPESTPAIAWPSNPAPTAAPQIASLADAQSFTTDPRPAIARLEPRPGALDAIEDYVPTAFVPDTLEISDGPDLGQITAFEPITSAFTIASLSALPDNSPSVMPTLETDAPEGYVAPVVEAAPQETELAALNTTVEETLQDLLGEPTVEVPEIAEPNQLDILPTDDSDLAAINPTIIEPTVTEPKVTEPELAEAPTPAAPADIIQTDLAAALPDTAPRARPGAFTAEIERQQFGGRTRDELAEIRPGTRPQSAQVEALVARAGSPPSELAIETSAAPRVKPRDFDAIVAAGLIQLRQQREARTLAALTPDTSSAIQAALADDVAAEEATRPQNSPRLAIPSNASVARQATVEEAIRLNRINLVGVFGSPSDRRALLRLPSGRYLKVQVGDRVDGGTVAGISDSTLQYQKGGRTVALSMPQG